MANAIRLMIKNKISRKALAAVNTDLVKSDIPEMDPLYDLINTTWRRAAHKFGNGEGWSIRDQLWADLVQWRTIRSRIQTTMAPLLYENRNSVS